ncbi:peptidoglycan-binding protein [Streptomyces sp. TX20-6-3]|uniref:peptidoglycan-binding protein n=1 Tax=Streptomyces sp. TX20-6-3 TaxID=3028705 RepID=UPI0029AD937F|nr:peptidoglycan-binding protein [Streptomyces sp. TX20-6-3]MDX2561194.1 peptidoglycan-binding protein [Streptomyces sp. TX20-6-3]
MPQERGGQDQSRGAAARLALLLRGWWEESGNSAGGIRPTQQALAARLGIDQTTLSRYLNPRHPSIASPRVVEALHAQLRAPAEELEQAKALCRVALRDNGRRPAGDNTGEPPAPLGAADGSHEAAVPEPVREAVPAAVREAVPEAVPAAVPAAVSATGRRRAKGLRPALVAAAIVAAFAAGMVVQERLTAQDHGATAGAGAGAAGAVAVSEAPYAWPLLRMGEEDQFARARALQYLLNSYGYDVRADGFFRQDTRDAVVDFQRRHDLSADGKVGDQTWPELVAKEVGPGSGAFEVRAVQELLNNVDQGGTAVSGRFTAATTADVRYFQRTHGLPATGRVNVDTWLALLVQQLPPVKAPAYQRATSPQPTPSV